MNFQGSNIEATTMVNQISTGEIVFEDDNKPKIADLTIDGQSFTLNKNQLKGSTSGFNIYNHKISTLSNVIIRLPINKELVNIVVPKLVFSADLFYTPQPEMFDKLEKMKVLAVEMELAGIYGLAAEYSARALGILTVSDQIRTHEHMTADARQTSFGEMIELALETAVRL